MSFIRIENVNKYYGKTHAVIDLDLEISKSAITVLLGSSGCGKTTTLRLIAGLEKPNSGHIWIGDQHVSGGNRWKSATERQIGMVFQDYALFPHLTVAQNITFGLTKQSRSVQKSRTADLLDLVGLMGMEDRYPHQLSGGQQQRVALARALAPSPKVILLDEPFSNLDASLRQTMREDVRRILHESEVTTVFVTHDQEEALRLADELVVMEGGHLMQTGPPEKVYQYPTSLSVAQFLAKVNVVPGYAAHGRVKTELGHLSLHNPALSGKVQVVTFPETITFASDPQGNATVTETCYFGFHQVVSLKLESGQIVQARTWSYTPITIGEKVQTKVELPVVAFTQYD